MCAVLDSPKLVGVSDYSFSEQEPGSQLTIRAGRPHNHREGFAMYPDFQRFLGNCAVHRTRGGSALHFDNRHRPPAVGSRGDRSTAVVGSHSGDKHVAPVRVAQLTLVDDRQSGHPRRQRGGK